MGDIFERREPFEGLEPSIVIVGIDEELEILPQLIMAALVVTFDGAIFDVRFIRSTSLLAQEWFGLMGRCSMPFLATYLVEAMHTVTRGPANTILGADRQTRCPFGCLPAAIAQNRIVGEDLMEPLENGIQ